MASSNLIKQLQERGLVAQVTDEEALAERLAQGPIALYCGFDPTADSLHLGHLVPLLCILLDRLNSMHDIHNNYFYYQLTTRASKLLSVS